MNADLAPISVTNCLGDGRFLAYPSGIAPQPGWHVRRNRPDQFDAPALSVLGKQIQRAFDRFDQIKSSSSKTQFTPKFSLGLVRYRTNPFCFVEDSCDCPAEVSPERSAFRMSHEQPHI
jgi:hypothetical protein